MTELCGFFATIASCSTTEPPCAERPLDAAAFIFTDSIDGLAFWRPDSTSRRFRAVCAKAGIDGIHLYSLRYQAATALIDSGADAKTVSERLGNSVRNGARHVHPGPELG